MDIVPTTLTTRGSLIDLSEVDILVKLAHNSNATVRFNTINTLTHLPLPQQGWVQVAELIRQELQKSKSFDDRAALLEIGTWIPGIFNAKDEVIVIEEDPKIQYKLLDKVDRIRSEYPIIREANFDCEWAISQAPGFVLYSQSELRTRRSQFEAQASLVAKKLSGWHEWYNNDKPLGIDIEDPVLVTLLFERAHEDGGFFVDISLTNNLLSFLEKFEYFRPDLNGLFQEYHRCVEKWSSSRGAPLDSWLLLGRDDEDPYSWHSWQIAWTVSRGGLKGLVSALENHLTANDYTRQVAALGLIADSADYTLQRPAACFGGGIRPPRIDPDYALRLWVKDETEPKEAAEEEKALTDRQVRMLTAAYPRRLSKGEDSLFIVSIHLDHERQRAIEEAKYMVKIEAAKGENVETSSSERIDTFGTVVVKLSSQDINFDPENGVTVTLQDIKEFKNIPFTAKPKATCDLGNRLVRISVTRKDSEEEILSKAFRVRIDDYAFDHVSRPLLATVMTIFTATASAVSYALGILEQVDTTTGVMAGTAFFVLAGAVGLGNRLVYRKPTIMIQVQ